MTYIFVLDNVWRVTSLLRTDTFAWCLESWHFSDNVTSLVRSVLLVNVPWFSRLDSTRTPSVLPSWLVSLGRQIFMAIESRQDNPIIDWHLQLWFIENAIQPNCITTWMIGSKIHTLPILVPTIFVCGKIFQNTTCLFCIFKCLSFQTVYLSLANKQERRDLPHPV